MPYALGGYNWIQDPDGKGYLFNVAMSNYNTSSTGSENLTEKQQKKIEKAVQKAFEGLEPMSYGGEMGYSEEYMSENVMPEAETVTETDVTAAIGE